MAFDAVSVIYYTQVEVPVTSSAIQSLIEASSASLEHGWEVGWSLASYNDGPQPLADARQSQVFIFCFSLCF